jgi:hypothetical protein
MSHAWRPLIVIVSVLIVVLIGRQLLAPNDFSAKDGDYKYQWHRLSSEQEWKDFPVKSKGRGFCEQCHPDKVTTVKESGHFNVQCESCHAQFVHEKKSHPIDLKTDFGYLLEIGIDRSRELCKRCHAKLPYRPKVYQEFAKGTVPFKMIDPMAHNPGIECVTCHDVHRTGFKKGM